MESEYARYGESVLIRTRNDNGFTWEPATIDRVLKSSHGTEVYEVVPNGNDPRDTIRVGGSDIRFEGEYPEGDDPEETASIDELYIANATDSFYR